MLAPDEREEKEDEDEGIPTKESKAKTAKKISPFYYTKGWVCRYIHPDGTFKLTSSTSSAWNM